MNVREFDLNLLFVLEALVEEQSVTRAGKRLGLSQPAVSAALARLRDTFDDQLFVRSDRGVKATLRAQHLAGNFAEALAIIRDTLREQSEFDPLKSAREFRIGMIDVGEVAFLPKIVRHLSDLGSSISVSAISIDRNVLGQFDSSSLDLVLGYWPNLTEKLGFRSRHLFTEHFACLCRADHPTIGAACTLDQYLASRHLVVTAQNGSESLVDRALAPFGRQREVAARVTHFLAIPAILEGSSLVATIPAHVGAEFASAGPLRLVPLPFRMPHLEVGIYSHRRSEHDPAVQWMIDLIAHLFCREDVERTIRRAQQRNLDRQPAAPPRPGHDRRTIVGSDPDGRAPKDEKVRAGFDETPRALPPLHTDL